ncbi:DMT family permease [Vibrio sinaloensis DSM 21326]|uniref:DMT family permease n=1 Tax=Vibrio sinaloensis DSM 21326 TaxID=945550 RepID=E8M3F6_PHOS4|nr:DMT family transporter [Vibrio sinaloensis]EGA71462.1 DMT family permease [Vibrio sinaloensis DSM 21326]
MSHSVSLLVALFAFAANSFFCRFALAEQSIDPGSFTLIRLLSGAVTLVVIMVAKRQLERSFLTDKLSWWSGIALFGYAVTFSFAYTQLTTGTGALILFGMVQLTLVAFHVYSGHRLNRIEWLGIATALSGFVLLMLPSAQTPSLTAAIIMLLSGIGWAIFTLLGRRGGAPAKAITHGFVLASVIALCVSPWLFSSQSITVQGVGWALLSGIFASGFGYIVWYQVVKRISVLQASIAQLAVPVIAFAAGSIGLAESISLPAIISSLLVLGGIAMIFVAKPQT